MLRTFTLLLALAVLVALVVWITAPEGVPARDEGVALRLAARPGRADLLVERAPGSWVWGVEPAGAATPRWVELPGPVRGLPALDDAGRVHLLTERGVGLVAPVDEVPDAAAAGDAPAVTWRPAPLEARGALQLVGVGADGAPVLRESHPEGDRLFLRDEELGWLLLGDGEDRARVPADSHVVLAGARPALAFRGPEGWEAWLHEARPARRLMARRRHGGDAVFTPDGRALVVDGIVDGLDRLELEEARMRFMADGNLGSCPRVPFSAAVRGDPPLLVSPKWDSQGFLQVNQTHLGGGGRHQFTTGQSQHYLPRVSPGGRWMTYAQADFDPEGDDAFREDLYLFDFDGQGRQARHLGSRPGGAPHRGPVFLGDGARLAWIADGRLLLARVEPAPAPP